MVVEMLAGAVDGWDLALDSLRAENAAAEVGPARASRRRPRPRQRAWRPTTPSALPSPRRRCSEHPDGNDHDGSPR